MPPLVIAAGLAAAGSIGGALIGSNAAQSAASTQAQASDQAAQLQATAQKNALNFQKQVFQTGQQNQAPFLAAGQRAVDQLSGGLRGGKPDTTGSLTPTSLNQPWATPFQPPTAAQAAATPGYQFALEQGQQALERSAAAQGDLLTGGTVKSTEQYAQGLADTNYQQVYNNALQQYQQGYNVFQNNQANQFNRLASVAGLGQTTAAQLGQQGNQAAGINSNTLLSGAQGISNTLQNAGAARASGYVGSANALASGLGGVANTASLVPLLSLMQQQGATQNPYGDVTGGTGAIGA